MRSLWQWAEYMQGSTATCADFSCGGTLHPGVWRCGMGAPDIVAGTALAPDAAHLIMAHSHKTAEPAREYSVDKPKVCVLLFIGACASVCTNAFGVAVRPVPAAGTEYPGYGMSGAECPGEHTGVWARKICFLFLVGGLNGMVSFGCFHCYYTCV